MLLSISIVFLVFVLCQGHPDKYLNNLHRPPNYCCQLEWTDIEPGDPLPDDYVVAGQFWGENWAFTRSSWPTTAVKSPRRDKKPNMLGYTYYEVNPWPILTNRHVCKIGWYRKQHPGELVPEIDGLFFPTLGYSKFGDFARYQMVPGRFDDKRPIFPLMKVAGPLDWIQYPENAELLYVDCYRSMLSKTRATLYNISYDARDLDTLKEKAMKHVHVTKTMINDSPVMSKANVKFAFETVDSASLELSSLPSDIFKVDRKTYEHWSTSGRMSTMFEAIGINADVSAIRHSFSLNERDIFHVSRPGLFEFSQEISLPPFSETTLTAFSKPIQGSVPFTAIYELQTPETSSAAVDILEKGLKKYGLDRTDRTSRGTVLVHFEGSMVVNAGHDDHVEIKSIPISSDNRNQ